MTTNHVEHLDPALIRPGRADIRVEVQLANRDMISQLFIFIYSSGPSNRVQHHGLSIASLKTVKSTPHKS